MACTHVETQSLPSYIVSPADGAISQQAGHPHHAPSLLWLCSIKAEFCHFSSWNICFATVSFLPLPPLPLEPPTSKFNLWYLELNGSGSRWYCIEYVLRHWRAATTYVLTGLGQYKEASCPTHMAKYHFLSQQLDKKPQILALLHYV